MDHEALEKELREQRALIEKIYVSAEKTRKYFLWTMWGTLIVFLLPLIAIAIALPYMISTLTGAVSTAGLGL